MYARATVGFLCVCALSHTLNVQGSYPGTLFRFPLRSTTTAASSNIKPQPTNPQQALQLLQSLTEVLPQALLFLKSLQEIEVYVVGGEEAAAVCAGPVGPEAGAEEAAPKLLFKANLSPLDGGCCIRVVSTQPVT
jgi:hypothetical protein